MSFRTITGLAGIVAVVLGVVTTAMFGQGPGTDPSGAEILAWASDNQTILNTILVLGAIQVFVVWVFVAGVYGVLRPGEPDREPWSVLGLTGGIAVGAMLALQGIVVTPILVRLRGLGDTTALFAYDLTAALQSALAIAVAAALLGYGVAILRTGELPGWLAYLGFLGAIVALIGGAAVVPTAQMSGIGLATQIAAVLFLLWVLLASIWMLRPARTASPSAQRGPAMSG